MGRLNSLVQAIAANRVRDVGMIVGIGVGGHDVIGDGVGWRSEFT